MANAILLNQSTELTKDNILSTLNENIVTKVAQKGFGLEVTAQDQNGNEPTTTQIDLSTEFRNLVSNYITFSSDITFEKVDENE